MTRPIDLIFDMETQDPDDYLTLLLLLGHPLVRLKAVTVMPGSPTQVGLVRRTLDAFDHAHIPVGAYQRDHPKPCISPWHERAYGTIIPDYSAEPAGALLARLCDEHTTLLTGAPIKNLGEAMAHDSFLLGRWVAQGGFAGEGVVPTAQQLPKFAGLTTCPTFNLNGAPKVALDALDDPRILQRDFVSKNVCHGVLYDLDFHRMVAEAMAEKTSLQWIYKGMSHYLKKHHDTRPVPMTDDDELPDTLRLLGLAGQSLGVMTGQEAMAVALKQDVLLGRRDLPVTPALYQLLSHTPSTRVGKKLHDPLAACCAIDPEIGTWAHVKMFRKRGEWGSRLAEGSSTRIIIAHDDARFRRTFLM